MKFQDPSIKKFKLPFNQNINQATLLQIAKEKFPGYESYTQNNLGGKFVCINRNSLFRVMVKVKHKPAKNESVVRLVLNCTFLGTLLSGPIWGAIAYKDFLAETAETFRRELERLN